MKLTELQENCIVPLQTRARHIGQGSWQIEVWRPAPAGVVAVSTRTYGSFGRAIRVASRASYTTDIKMHNLAS